jgi:cytochrome c oxidase subunit 1
MHAPEPPRGFWRRWVFSTDHKVIGIQYLILAMVAVTVGVVLSLLMRWQLAYPAQDWSFLERLLPRAFAGGAMAPEFYLSLVTMHGTIMVFFVLTTAPLGGFGNYVLPLQVGARDMAFPRLNMMSFWATCTGFLVLMAAFFVAGGAPLAGWTAYPPLSALGPLAGPGQGLGMDLWIASLAFFCAGSLLGSLNFLATTLGMRCRGLSLWRLPLPVWAWFTTAMLALLAFPVLLAAAVLLLLDRNAGTSFFVPGGLVVAGKPIDHHGGSPLLWQHLFWFFGHPEVYIAILPGMGAVSQILAVFARKPVFGYRAMAGAMLAIGALGFLIWGHHMFVSGMSPYSAMAFSVLTLVIGVPSALKTVNWLGTLWGGTLRLTAAMLYALGFVSLFVSGGLTGLFLGQTSLDLYLHDTFFVVGHFHMIMGVAAVFALFAATQYWYPKMFGRLMHETAAKIHCIVTLVGVYAVFVPMHLQGMMGHPRRYYDASTYASLAPSQAMHGFITVAAVITAAVQLLFVWNVWWSRRHGAPAGDNPWQATTLEWTTTSPPPLVNFVHEPVVHHPPYAYGVPGATREFIMQDDSPDAMPASQRH